MTAYNLIRAVVNNREVGAANNDMARQPVARVPRVEGTVEGAIAIASPRH